MAATKKKQFGPSQDTILEQLRDVGGGMVKSAASDVVGGVATGILNELFSPKKGVKNGEQTILTQERHLPVRSTPEIKSPEVVLFTAQEANVAHEVEALRAELKKTADELKELNTAIIEVEKAVVQTSGKVGTYHLSFFAKLRSILKLFRQQVSESRLWLEETFTKKRKRNYWAMFKKHGTTFGLSQERALASQAG